MNNTQEYLSGLVEAHVSDMELRGYLNGTDGDVSECDVSLSTSEIVKVGEFDGNLFNDLVIIGLFRESTGFMFIEARVKYDEVVSSVRGEMSRVKDLICLNVFGK